MGLDVEISVQEVYRAGQDFGIKRLGGGRTRSTTPRAASAVQLHVPPSAVADAGFAQQFAGDEPVGVSSAAVYSY